MPSRKPTVAGTTDMRPMSSDSSMLGMSSDHTEAATITPDAKPSSTFCSQAGIVSRMKNTKPAPSTVPTRGMSNPMTNPSMAAKLDIFRQVPNNHPQNHYLWGFSDFLTR